ncbi:unnamed protein product [Orchesella dallaii]|uniref:Uncharacterized protein n=1 Tax=Orchesella dallaii TaxID=48710 RepID=A0ABP1RCA8_9HEXA
MGHSDIVSILLIILTILANGAVVNGKMIVKRSIQDIANDYLKSLPEPINKTRNNVQDVEVFVKNYNSNNEVGEGQLSFKPLNRKATDSFVQSRSDTVDNVDVEIVDKSEELMKTGTDEEHIAAAVTSYFIPQTQSPDVTSQFLTSDKPSCAFTFNSTKHTHSFEVDRNLEQEYFISVVVEKMNCSGNKDDAGQAPTLSIKGAGEENAQEICKVFDSSRNNFQSVDFCIDGGKHVTIIPVGNWSGVSASLVVTLYYETLDGCDSCTANNHFCCGNANAKCPGSPSYGHDISNTVSKSKGFNKELSRCILKPKRQDGKSLFCDGHPNCGLYSNKDELVEFCPNDEYDYNTCYTCRIEEPNRILLTILLILVFCVFVPFCIFFVFCTKREVRSDLREDGRCPLLIEILFCPFSMNADNQNGAVRVNPGRRPRPNPRPPVRRSEEVNRPRQVTCTSWPGKLQLSRRLASTIFCMLQ